MYRRPVVFVFVVFRTALPHIPFPIHPPPRPQRLQVSVVVNLRKSVVSSNHDSVGGDLEPEDAPSDAVAMQKGWAGLRQRLALGTLPLQAAGAAVPAGAAPSSSAARQGRPALGARWGFLGALSKATKDPAMGSPRTDLLPKDFNVGAQYLVPSKYEEVVGFDTDHVDLESDYLHSRESSAGFSWGSPLLGAPSPGAQSVQSRGVSIVSATSSANSRSSRGSRVSTYSRVSRQSGRVSVARDGPPGAKGAGALRLATRVATADVESLQIDTPSHGRRDQCLSP